MTIATDRPTALADVVGQAEVLNRLRIVMAGSRERGVKPPHVLLSGPAGHGKTTLARIIAEERDAELIEVSGPTLKRTGDLCGLLTTAPEGGVVFVDEVHRLPKAVEELLYQAMEDGSLSIIVGSGPSARAITMPLPDIVLVGATTMPGSMSTPLRDRFGLHLEVAPYSPDELAEIVTRAWDRAGVDYHRSAATVIGERCKGVPRLALHLAARTLDYAATEGRPVDAETALEALEAFGVGKDGLDDTDLRILEALVTTFSGRPVGLAALAQALDLDVTTISNEREGPLVRAGLILRTPQGRLATPLGHDVYRERAA